MSKHLLYTAVALLISGPLSAAPTDPFDFDYQVVARASDRPAMIFNDGSSTYIQPRAGQQIVAGGGQQSGPYIVLDGVPDVVRYTTNGSEVVARWTRANGFTGEPANPAGELPRGFSGFSGRIALIGNHSGLALVRQSDTTMPLAPLIKTLAPAGWTGSAQKDIALSQEMRFATRAGENWVQALERLLAQRDLYAELDFERRNIALRATAPKSLAVAGTGVASPAGLAPVNAVPQMIAASTAVASAAEAAGGPTEGDGSALGDAFDAQAIRDTKAGRIEIRFEKKPTGLVVRRDGGEELDTTWNEDERVLSFRTADRFTVSGGGKSVEVARVPGIAYLFPQDNPAGLERVFEKDGATYLSFRQSLVQVSVFDESNQSNGEHKDRYYKYNGIGARLTVLADGKSVTVSRQPEVRFYERAAAL
jgi:hypothetical protein